jgi:uncharacterized protein (TIGR02444 family)
VTAEALWPYALEVHGRPGVDALLLELQDAHGGSVPYLLWSVWMAASGRSADDATLRAGAELARAWQDAAIAPLRRLRRDLKSPGRIGPQAARERLRNGVKALELDAERMLLRMLEEASPPPTAATAPLLAALDDAARVWGDAPPADLLARLASLA